MGGVANLQVNPMAPAPPMGAPMGAPPGGMGWGPGIGCQVVRTFPEASMGMKYEGKCPKY